MTKPDPKSQLSRAALESNIEYYNAMVEASYQRYQAYVQDLQYWLDQLQEHTHGNQNHHS
jgi:hypothetical protein